MPTEVPETGWYSLRIKDDDYDGDTNGDGDRAVPRQETGPESTYMVYSGNEGIGEFDYCRIRYGGGSRGDKR